MWTISTASVADQFVFTGNGRCATQAFFSDGAYRLSCDAITLTPDDRNSRAETGFIRVEEESRDEGATWVEALYLLRVSAVEGKDYEVRHQKK